MGRTRWRRQAIVCLVKVLDVVWASYIALILRPARLIVGRTSRLHHLLIQSRRSRSMYRVNIALLWYARAAKAYSRNKSSESVSSIVDIGRFVIGARLEDSDCVVATDCDQFAAIGGVCAECRTRRVYLLSVLPLCFPSLYLRAGRMLCPLGAIFSYLFRVLSDNLEQVPRY